MLFGPSSEPQLTSAQYRRLVEARSPGGERFGQQRLVDLTRRALTDEQTLAETVRRLVRSVQGHRYGSLDDDATILLVEWHPPV